MTRIAVGFIACLLVFGASAQTIPTLKQTGAPTSAEEPKSQQQQATSPPVTVNVLPAPKSEEEAEQERRERAEKTETDKRLVALTEDLATFTRWLAFATFALVAVTAGLVVMGIKQSRDMRQSITAAKDAAKAARDQVELSRHAMISTDRAFIYLRRIKTMAVLDEETGAVVGWNFLPVWKNTGKTPTRNAVQVVNRTIPTSDLPAGYDFPDHAKKVEQKLMVAPNGVIRGGPFYCTLDTLRQVRAQKRFYYMWGWMDYDDVFDGTPRHRTEFCVRVLVESDPTRDDAIFRYNLVGPMNGQDEDCYRQPGHYVPPVAFAP